MKVDLTTRDIELILSLLSESAGDDIYFKSSMLYSMEELMLLEKLESALSKCDSKEADILDTGSSGFCN